MNRNRPVFLNLTQIRFPVTALVSISHRISGVVLFVALPWLLYIYSNSVHSFAAWQSLRLSLNTGAAAVLSFIVTSAIIFHLLAGLRHLLMDLGFGESWKSARLSAFLVFISWVVLSIICGVVLW